MRPDMKNASDNKRHEAEKILQRQYALACHSLDAEIARLPAITPALSEDEARYFVEGIRQGLFAIDDEGYVQSAMLPKAASKNVKQKMLSLFWKTSDGRRLFREGVCQMATAASLVLGHGWPCERIVMEPGRKEFGKLAYGVDFLIRPTTNERIICGEVKKNAPEFQKLIAGLHHCFERGAHSKTECAYKTNHAKYEFCCSVKPSHLFVTAPGEAITLTLSYKDKPSIIAESPGLMDFAGI